MKSTQFEQTRFFNPTTTPVHNDGLNRCPFEENDYSDNLSQKQKLIEEWKGLSSEQKKEIRDLRRFFVSKGFEDLSSQKRNYQIFNEEIKSRTGYDSNKRVLLLDSITNDTDTFELLHSLEDVDKIKKIYKYQKKTATDGINNEVAEQVKNCFTQGRELFESGKSSPTSVKPLLYFYSLTAYAYGLIVISNPIRFSLETLTGHHGLDYVHDEYSIKIGGDVPYGTFSDLLLSFPTGYLIDSSATHIIKNNYKSIKNFFEFGHKISLGSIFTYMPELSGYMTDFLKMPNKVYPVKIKSVSLGMAVGYEIIIGDGRIELNEDRFDQMISERNKKIDGRLKYLVPLEKFLELNLTLIQDIYGEFYIIDSPLKFSIPEITLHFIAMFAFSNIQRYDPPLWSKVLNNKINSDVSYLIYKYIAVYEKKLPYLILRIINNIYPILKK